MAQYRFLAFDLRTRLALCELPLSNVKYGWVLNDAGSFSADLPIGDTRSVSGGQLAAVTSPPRTMIVVERDDVPVWAGILWTTAYDSMSQTLQLGGAELFSYFTVGAEIWTTLTYAGVDQLAIARDLIDQTQALPGGNIGVTTAATTSGVLRDRTYFFYDSKHVGDAMKQLAAVINGFDFSIEVAWSADALPVPATTLQLWYPRKGRSVISTGSTGLVFEFGRNLISYTWPEDGTATVNSVRELGNGSADTMLIGTATRTDLIDAGYPLLRTSLANKDITVQATLDSIAQFEVLDRSTPVALPELTVRADSDPSIGTWTVGDDCRIRIFDDPRWPQGLDTYRRIVAAGVDIADNGAETVKLTTGELVI